MLNAIRNIVKVAIILIICTGHILAIAGDEKMTGKVTDAITKLDKHGKEYCRIIVEQDKNIDGTAYTSGVPVMFFSDTVATGKTYKVGDAFTGIVSGREYQGRMSYTFIAPVKTQAATKKQ